MHHDDLFEARAHHCRHARGRDFALPGAEPHYPPDVELEPIHLDIALHLDLDAQSADAVITHTVRARQAGPRTLVLHGVDFEDVTAADQGGFTVACEYDGREIRLTWSDAFEAGEERRVAVSYAVDRPSTGLFFSKPSDEYPDQAWYAATDHETERARHWLACVDLPSVRPTLHFHLRAEQRFTILANGAHAGEDVHDDGTKTVHWKLEQPCPSYLTCFAVGDFVELDSGEFEGMPVGAYTSRAFTSEDLERSFGRTRDILAWMTKKYDYPFPYPKYFQFALPGFGGAMENISLVAWDDQFVLDETLAKEWTWLVDQINVHEMAHSYFGDLVVCRDYAHAWLKESWATYTEQLWLEDSKGDDEGLYDFYSNVQRYADEADNNYKRPIVTREFNHSWQMYDRHLYPGGASRLHMLRKELGDDVFFGAVQAYLKKFAFKVVETSDFRRVLEEHSGRSLVKWFDQWLHSKGYPKLKASFRYDDKKCEATFSIEQTQADEKQDVGLFEMPIDLGWVIDGEMHLQTVTIDKAKHSFVVKLPAAPEQVRIDPTGRAVMRLEFNPGEDKLRTQLTDAQDVIGRILAGDELCKTGRRKNVEAVRDAYRDERFWGVRVRFAESLSNAGTQVALDALAELIAEEQDGMVLESLIRAAGKHRDAGIAAAIEKRLDAGIGMHRATQAAYAALGAQRSDAPYERLVEASAHADRYGVEQVGALQGLAATRRAEAVEVLQERTRFGTTSNRVRPGAAAALAALGRSLDEHRRPAVLERLVDLLRDPIDRVRWGAARGITILGEPAGIGALTAYRAGVSEQEQTDVDGYLASLRKKASAKPSGPSKDVEELREKLRKLEATVDKLSARVEANGDSESSDSSESDG